MRTKIYTKSGDLGETSLIGGLRVSKADARLESYGTVDELNSTIGVCVQTLKLPNTGISSANFLPLTQSLTRIQNDLFIIGSHLACENERWRENLPKLQLDFVPFLEREIDSMTEQLPKLTEFILPGGSEPSAFLHLARTICRRAERNVCSLERRDPLPEVLIQLNRLSDYLFVAARYANLITKTDETKWQKPT